MYVNFFNMVKAPFHITPDPEFLFLSPSHKEALGAIIYCITKRKGFVSIIGEVGTGKTTILRSYLARCERQLVKPIYLFNPSVTFAELLKSVFQELGITPSSENLSEMVRQLHAFLISEYEQGRNIVLIIDEAQNMPVTTFEQLRILSNLETPKDKLLQIVLVGQPELKEKLEGKELRQLNQRLAIRATLRPLSPGESWDYVLFRLAKVTSAPEKIFTAAALKKIIKAAAGSPRMLNILCDNALVAGFGNQEKKITGKMAKQVIADFEGKGFIPTLTWKHAPILVAAFLLSAFAMNGLLASPSLTKFGSGPNELATTNGSLAQIESKTPMELPLSATETELSEKVVLTGGTITMAQADSKAGASLSRDGSKTASNERENLPSSPGKKRKALIPSSSSSRESKAGSTKRTIKKGEYLSQICLDKYGFVNDQVIKVVKDNNPRISDADLIFIGETILLPELSNPDTRYADSHVR